MPSHQRGLVENFRNPLRTPGLEVKVAIVHGIAEQEKLKLPKDVALYLAENIQSNSWALRRAILRLQAHSSLTGTDITLRYTQQVLKNFIDSERPGATAHPFQGMPSGQRGAERATGTYATATDRSFLLSVLETRERTKITRAHQKFEVNMREHEREHLAHRDGYERELERRAKKRKSA